MFKNRDLIADVLHDSKIVGDKKVRKIEFLLQIHQEVHDLSLDGDVESTDGFIADDEFRFNGKGAGDADALALAPAEFVGKTSGVGGIEADQLEKFGYADRAIGRGHFWKMDLQRLGQDGADPETGIERVVRILENHLNFFAIGAKGRP